MPETSTAQKYARAFGLPEEDIAYAEYDMLTETIRVTYGIDMPRYKQKTIGRRATREFADFFKAPIFAGKSVDYILDLYLKEKGRGSEFVIREPLSAKSYYTSTEPVFGKMTMKQFIETEIKERGNYTHAEVQNWIRKYNISENDLAIWVSPKKWVANRYNLLAEEWDKAEKVPESEMSVYEIKGNEGFIIPESDDGDEGYLFVFKRIMNHVIRESGNQGTAPGQHEIINKIIEDVKKKPISAPEKRDEIRRELTALAGSIDQSAITELRNFRPLGMMSEFGAVMGAEPRKGVRIDTPFGPYVFDEKRVPSKERVDRWYAQHKEAEGIRTLAVEYAFGLGASYSTVTGNFRVVERGRRFKEQGMLSPEEEQILNALEKYWQDHPELDRQKGYGIWGHNLEIMVPESLRKNMIEKKGSLIDALLRIEPGKDIRIDYNDVPKGVGMVSLPSFFLTPKYPTLRGIVVERRGDLLVAAIQSDREIVAYLYVQKGSQLIQIRPIPRQKTPTKEGEVNTIEYNMWVERIKKEAPEYLPEWETTPAGIRAGDIIIHRTAKYTAVVDKVYQNGNIDITVVDAKGIPEWEKSIKEGFPIKTTVKGVDIDRYFEKPVIKGTEAKQPWEMTRSEAIAEAAKPLGSMGISWGEMRTALSTSRKFAESLHKDMVKLAIVEGKPVPPEVLKEYPDLVKKEVQLQKEPWQMTYREFAEFFEEVWNGQKFSFAERVGKPLGIQSQAGEPYHMIKGRRIGYSGSLSRDRWRLAIVDKALSEGKKVPEEVLTELHESLKEEKEKLGGTGMAEQYEEKPPGQEVRDWMKRALGIEDYKGGRHDRISMLALLIQNSELGNIRSINEAGQMARVLGRDLGYGEPPAYGKSQERYYAEKIAAETGREVHIIKSSDIIKPPAEQLDVQAIFDRYTAGYSKLSFKAVTYLSDLKLAMEIRQAVPEISAEDAKRLAPTIRSMAEKKYSELEEQELKPSAPAVGAIAGGTPARQILTVTEPEGYYFGTQIEVLQGADPDLEPYFTGTVKRLLNNGELVEVHPEGDPREVSVRVPVDRVNVTRLVTQEGAAPKKLYRYYYAHRPPGIGTQPKGFINHESWLPARTAPHGRTAFGWVEYDRPLTPEEISGYELFEDEVELPKLVKELVQFARDEGIDEVMKAIDATYGGAVLQWLKSQKRLRAGVGQKEQVRDEIIRLAGITAAPPAVPPGIEKIKPEQAIRLAADSIDTLRRVDVFRVLNQYKENSIEIGNYIKSNRPDLVAEVDKILGELQPKDKFDEIQDQMQRDKDKIIGEHLRELAAQMTSKEFINEALKLNKYRESYEKDPKLMNEFTNSGIQKWKELVEKHGEIGKLPDKVIEDYIKLFGEQALFSVFRGTKAKGIEGWRLPAGLIESAESLYKRYTSGYSSVSLLGIVRQDSKDLAHSIGYELKLDTTIYTPAVLLPVAEKFKEFAQKDYDKEHQKHLERKEKEQAEKEKERIEGGQAFWDEVKDLKFVDFEVQHDVNPDKPTRTYYHVYDRTFAILENGKKVQVSYVIYKGEEGKRAAKATKEFYMTFYGQYMGKPLSEWITYDQLMSNNRYEDYKAQQPKPGFTFIPEAPPAAAAPPGVQAMFNAYIRSTVLTTGALASPKFLSDERMAEDIERNIQVSKDEARALVPQFRVIAEKLINKEEIESVKETFGIDLEQEAHNLGIDIKDYAIIKAGDRVFLQHKTTVQRRYEIKPPTGYMEERERRLRAKPVSEKPEERILGELRTKYRFSRPEGDMVAKAIDSYIKQRDKSFVHSILIPVRDGKFIADDLVEMVEGTYWLKKEIPVPVPQPPAAPSVAKPVQSIQEIKQQVLSNIQAASTVEELQPVLKGIGFLPLPEPEKREVMDAYQNKYSILISEIPFGVPVTVEEKPKVIGALTPQQLFEAEQRRKAAEARRVSAVPTLTGAAVTARRLEMFEPGAMEKAKAEAEARKRIEQLGLPYEVHPYIRKLAAGTQGVMKLSSKRERETVEDIVLARYVRYCPPGTIIDNRNVPKVPERWWVYPPKLRACMGDIEKKLAEAGAGLVRESQRFRYSIYQDGGLFANEDNTTEANNIYEMLVRTYPRSVVELRENFVHPRIHQTILKKYPASREVSVVREATQLTPSMRSYIRGAVAVRDVIHYYRDGSPPIRGVAYRARDGTYFVEAQDGQVYSAMGWEEVKAQPQGVREPAGYAGGYARAAVARGY